MRSTDGRMHTLGPLAISHLLVWPLLSLSSERSDGIHLAGTETLFPAPPCSSQFIDVPPQPKYCEDPSTYALPNTQPIDRPDAVITLQVHFGARGMGSAVAVPKFS